ncbi:MAG: UvrD-helicase domain-containing protein [Muribaculaceae bacterium]|nr:UvrD-helicase domain-containing protein [Muribaculaceae bacterium]
MLTIFKASAGSGKTYNLTRDYIRFLLARKTPDGYRLCDNPHSRHSHILAITFTNKATAEMSERIVKALALLSGMGDRKSPYESEFVREFRCSPDQLHKAAAQALKDLLFDYTRFNVSTIDAFFQSVLRAFTREVELPDNFNVDLNDDRAITIGLTELFNSINEPAEKGSPRAESNKWLSDWLVDYMKGMMTAGKSFNLFSPTSNMFGGMVKSFSKLINETFKKNIGPIRDYYSNPALIVGLRNRLAEISGNRYQTLRSAIEAFRSTGDFNLSTTFGSNIKKWENGEKVTALNSTLLSIIENPAKAFKAKEKFTDEAGICAQAVVKAAINCYEYQHTLAPIADNIFKLGLLGRILTAVDDYCRENNFILLSETNNILKGIINDDETPFIYEKLGFYLNHYLIDEFQDTSAMQWDNLKPLLLESLSRGCDNLVIGDEKQSIYRFRNADPELLGHIVADDITKKEAWAKAEIDTRGETLADNSNWRSSREVITFNNTIFHFLPRRLSATFDAPQITDTYRGIIQQIHPVHIPDLKPGYVRIQFLASAPKGKKAKAETSDGDAPEQMTQQLFIETELRRILTEGKYQPSDIAILVRSNDEAAKIIHNLLEAMNRPDDPLPRIPIMSNDALTLGSSRAVNLIISILRLVNLPEFLEPDFGEDQRFKPSPAYRRAKLVNRYHYYLHKTVSDDDGRSRPLTPDEALAEAIRNPDLPDGDQADYASLLDMECLNLPGVIERIIARYIPEQLTDSETIFLSAFQDAVIDFSSRGNHDIRQFLKWWDGGGYRTGVSTPTSLNALKVMTIHQSKGLEFDCVILPIGENYLGSPDTSKPEWVELDTSLIADRFDIRPELLPKFAPLTMSKLMADSDIHRDAFREHVTKLTIDELNVTYVAFTRAVRELLICAPIPSKPDESSALGANLYSIISAIDEEALNAPNAGLTDEKRLWTISLNDKLNERVFTLGSPTVKDERQEQADSKPGEERPVDIIIDRYNLIDNATRNLRNELSDEYRPVIKAKTDAVDPFSPSDPRHIGTFLHAVMSLVTTPDRLPSALKRLFYRYRIPEGMRGALRSRLEMALAEPEAARWFDGFSRVITERALTWQRDGEMINRRPDRIVLMPDGSAEIVDYKFVVDLPDDPTTEPKFDVYSRQVATYCRHLAKAKKVRVKGYLWYISDTETRIIQVI